MQVFVASATQSDAIFNSSGYKPRIGTSARGVWRQVRGFFLQMAAHRIIIFFVRFFRKSITNFNKIDVQIQNVQKWHPS